jgi:geranylgeranyl diphosphate synthase type II
MLDSLRHKSICVGDANAEIGRLIQHGPGRVAKAAHYHFQSGGLRMRAQLGIDAAVALNLPRRVCLVCAVAPELLHNASLIHDDLQDGDTMRRGNPAVWSAYGKDTAILTGDYLISLAYSALADHPRPASALRAMHDCIATTIAGQTQDVRTAQPTPDDYEMIAANKSGPLLALPVRLALIAANAPGEEIATRVGCDLSKAYQTLDDIADRSADLAHGGTNVCLSFEALGRSEDSSKHAACAMAHASLEAARTGARALSNGTGTTFLALANHLETKLKDVSDAT